jgi:hypothetical protein
MQLARRALNFVIRVPASSVGRRRFIPHRQRIQLSLLSDDAHIKNASLPPASIPRIYPIGVFKAARRTSDGSQTSKSDIGLVDRRYSELFYAPTPHGSRDVESIGIWTARRRGRLPPDAAPVDRCIILNVYDRLTDSQHVLFRRPTAAQTSQQHALVAWYEVKWERCASRMRQSQGMELKTIRRRRLRESASPGRTAARQQPLGRCSLGPADNSSLNGHTHESATTPSSDGSAKRQRSARQPDSDRYDVRDGRGDSTDRRTNGRLDERRQLFVQSRS